MRLLWLALLAAMAVGDVFTEPESLLTRGLRGEPSATAPLVRQFRALPPVNPPAFRPLAADWQFALGDSREGLNTTLDRLPAVRQPVALPHRTLHADTPYWYTTEVTFATPTVLAVSADDGAQVYADGKRVPVRGDHFFLPASAGKTRLVIRVLNKALYGGLGGVQAAPQPEFEGFQERRERRERLTALVRKTRLLRNPTRPQIAAAEKAVVEEHASSLRAAERLLATLPLLLVGPYLQDAGTDRMTVVWETDVPCDSDIEWGERDAKGRKTKAKSDAALHTAALTGLKPDTAYWYRVRSGSVLSRQYTFRTLPATGAFAFTVWSDSHANAREGDSNDVFHQNVNAMSRLPIAFTVGTGDLVEQGNHKTPWVRFFESLKPLAPHVPVMLVGGNHDYDGCFEDLHSVYFERYARNKPRPQYFAWTAGNARFVALDPNEHFPTGIPAGSEQHRWLMRELESPEWKRADWHFIFLHQPPFSQGWADYHGDLPIRALFEPLIEKYGIDFIVAGHTHDYERWTRSYGRQKVHFLIVGGAGGGLEDEPMSAEPVMDKVIRRHHFGLFRIDGRQVIFEAIATDTRVLDRLEARLP